MRGTKISPPTDGMSLSQAHSLLFCGEHISDDDHHANGSNRKNNKKKAKKSRSRSTSPAPSIAAASAANMYNTNPGRKRPGFGAMCKEMDRYLKSIANGRGWLTMSPDLADWADEMREEYARYVEWKKTERLQGGGNGSNKRKRYRNRPKMTDEMVEKLRKVGFDLDENTGMSPPRKSRPSSSRGALPVTQWNDDALDDAARGTGADKDPKNSNTSGNSNSPPKKKRPRKNKKRKASDDAPNQNDAASSNSHPSDSVGMNFGGGNPSDAKSSNGNIRLDSTTLGENIVANDEDSSSLALDSNEGHKEKSPRRVYNDPGDPVCDIEIANQSECEDGADIGGEDEDDDRANDEEFAFNYIPLVERIVMLDSETNQPLSPSKQPPPRTIGMEPIMSPPQKEAASDSNEAQNVKAEGDNVGTFDSLAESKGAQSTESLDVESTKPPAETEEQPTQGGAVTKAAAKKSAASSPSTERPTLHAKAQEMKEEMKENTKKDPGESSRNCQDKDRSASNAQDDSEAKKSCNDANASDSQDNGDDQVSKLQAEVDALRSQLEEERRRREEAEAARTQHPTNIVSGGEEEPDDGKEEVRPAKVKTEVIEIDDEDEDDESADVSSKPTANASAEAKANPSPRENAIPDSQQVKQRMSDAVKTILSYPDVALYDALCSAGFIFKEIEAGEFPKLVDENGVSLEKRKEELSQLIKSEKGKCAPTKTNEAAKPAANNDGAKKQASLRQYAKSAQPSSRATASTNSPTSSAASTKSKTTTRSSDSTRQLASKQCCICKELHPQFRFSNEQWSKRNGYCHKCMVIERQKQAQTAWPPRQAAQWLHRRDRGSEKKKSSTAHRHEDYLYSQQEQQDRLFS